MVAPILLVALSEWAKLNQTVGGRLHLATPIALPCYATYKDGTGSNKHLAPDAAACASVNSNTGNSSFIVATPGGYVTYNYGTCQVTNQGCAASQLPDLLGTCYQGSVPNYYIDVRSPTDVAAGLQFAEKHSIPIVVKNTGHDYKGRSSAPNSLMLWTHNVQPPVHFDNDFRPDGCSASTGPALTYGAGQGFKGLFETAHANGMMAIGGTAPTVGASGGWVTGGGHSALSPTHGLGVDNVLEMKVVLPNGTFVTTNRCQNTDLFFALRGGGGGTFGVIMEMTARVYPEVPLQHVNILAPNLNLPGGAEQILDLLTQNTPQWSKDGWGGYMAAGGSGVGLLLIDMITPKLTLEEAKASMKPALDFANGLITNLSIPVTVNLTTEPNYFSYFNSPSAESLASNGVGSGLATASRLVPMDMFEDATKRSQFVSVMADVVKNAPVPAGFLMIPPVQYELPKSDQAGGPGESCLTPAWRSSYWHVLFDKSWSQGDATYGGSGSAQKALNASTTSADRLRAITPEGAYQNEGDPYEPNPAASFWGVANYDRLLAIKKSIDPGNILTCHQCIGWDPSDARYSCYPQVR